MGGGGGGAAVVLVRLLVLGSILALAAPALAAGPGRIDCDQEKEYIFRVCAGSIGRQGLSRLSDLLCICRIITPADEQAISVHKLVQAAIDSRAALPAGTRCGSYTVGGPPAVSTMPRGRA
ncbi:hypothetical protein BRADI_1g45354v3 [Brachypodium distachyon]|uniref:Bifunctional inhibitor/plant lipid transfer protein/seed storage helical domain-containing protein n=1 Tax=Brachypodium distachyon TaxID=15368 RepID=A0A0Q3NN27_BRADI|nr:hypothetical protein BRADI_1g45354v3 [Brachypodium distachyon]